MALLKDQQYEKDYRAYQIYMITDDGYTYMNRHTLNQDGTVTVDEYDCHPHVNNLKEIEKPDWIKD